MCAYVSASIDSFPLMKNFSTISLLSAFLLFMSSTCSAAYMLHGSLTGWKATVYSGAPCYIQVDDKSQPEYSDKWLLLSDRWMCDKAASLLDHAVAVYVTWNRDRKVDQVSELERH